MVGLIASASGVLRTMLAGRVNESPMTGLTFIVVSRADAHERPIGSSQSPALGRHKLVFATTCKFERPEEQEFLNRLLMYDV